MQFSTVLLAAAAAAGVSASAFGDALTKVVGALSTIDASVQHWQSSDGIQGAINIQEAYPALSSAVSSLQSAASGASVDDILGSDVVSLGSGVASLLNDLVTKAQGLKDAQAGPIVADDIKQLVSPVSAIEARIISVAPESKSSSVRSIVGEINSAFTAAGSAYNVDVKSLPSPK